MSGVIYSDDDSDVSFSDLDHGVMASECFFRRRLFPIDPAVKANVVATFCAVLICSPSSHDPVPHV